YLELLGCRGFGRDLRRNSHWPRLVAESAISEVVNANLDAVLDLCLAQGLQVLGPLIELAEPLRILGAGQNVSVVRQAHHALGSVDALADHVFVTGDVLLPL